MQTRRFFGEEQVDNEIIQDLGGLQPLRCKGPFGKCWWWCLQRATAAVVVKRAPAHQL